MKTRERLRIALQKSGRMAEPARRLLERAGFRFSEGPDRLFCHGEGHALDLLLVRDDDIPSLLAEGVCDLGVVGRDVLQEQQCSGMPRLQELRALGFARCRLALALPQEQAWGGPASLAGLRIATSHPGLLSRWLAGQGVDARVVTLCGSVEIAPRLGKADLVCDLVSTGATLAANQLREVATLLDSEAVLAAPEQLPDGVRGELLARVLRRLDGLLAGAASRLVLLHAPRSAVAAILDLLPESGPPGITPLDGAGDSVALQALCRGDVSWQQLEDIQRAGGSQVLVLPVERMLA